MWFDKYFEKVELFVVEMIDCDGVVYLVGVDGICDV